MNGAAFRRLGRERPVGVTAVISIVGYALVVGTLLGALPAALYPDLGLEQVNRLADLIAVINTAATVSLVLGWRWIRQGRTRRHRVAMLTAFGLILLFLVFYLAKTGGGGTKEFVGPSPARTAYVAVLAIHILLSIVAVPLVVFQVVTGLSYAPTDLARTAHPRVGRAAAGAWIVSLALGVVAYILLNHVYGWRFVAGGIG